MFRTASSLAIAVLLTGCAGSADPGDAAGPSEEQVQAVAGFYPLEYVTRSVGGDRVAVTNLTRPGAEPHDLELAPRDVATVSDADLVVYLSGFQPALDDAVESQAGHGLDVADAARLSPADAHANDEHGPDEHGHDEHGQDEHGHDEHAEDGGTDPHFWLDPTRLADVADAVAGRLAEIDPDGESVYVANAADLREQLTALDEELAEGLASCQVTHLVTSHRSLGYLADRYGFTQVGISGLSPEQEPDPGALADVADLVREHGVTTVYSEVLVDPAIAETVAAEAGATTAVLDTLEGLTDASPGEDYPSVMRANLETLRTGQSCS